MRIIAIANQKGGCGKTTVAINLSACLARQGRRTLLVDMDPQGHCAVGVAVPEEQIEKSMYDLLCTESPPGFDAVTWQISSNFDLAPATPEMVKLEQELAAAQDRVDRLTRILADVGDDYDYCVLDCPPSNGLLTGNALHAAGEIIVPVDTGFFALHGLTRQLGTISQLREQGGRDVMVRVLANLYDVRTRHAREVVAELRKKFADLMFEVHVNFNAKLREATGYGQPICEYAPSSPGHRDFTRLANEVIAAGEVDTVHHVLLDQASDLTERAEDLLATSAPLVGEHGTRGTEATPEEIERKIAEIYGVFQDEEGVHFRVHAPDADSVELVADFNGWAPGSTALKHEDDNGSFGVTLDLEPGRYRYRYVIDGQWIQDPHNTYVESNPYGELDSVVEVS